MENNDSEARIPDDQLTSSQREAAKSLQFFYRIHSLGISEVNGVKTRPFPMLIGPSGCGKTFLATRLAEKQGLPSFSVNISNWIPRGAKSETQITLDQISAFVQEHDRGVIFIDEVNKLKSRHADDSAWCMDNMNEVLAFLDMDERLVNMGFDGLLEKLRRGFLVIGAAAFQDEWTLSEEKPSLGFGADSVKKGSREDAYEQLVRSQNLVADELLFRFNDRLIIIAPPSREEFAERIVNIRSALGLQALSACEIDHLAQQAVESRKMIRWLEGYASQCLTEVSLEEFHQMTLFEPCQEKRPEKERDATTVPASRVTYIKAEKVRRNEWDTAFGLYDAAVQDLGRASNGLGSFVRQVYNICVLANESKGGRFDTVLADIGSGFKKGTTKKERIGIALRAFERLARWCFTAGLPLTPDDERAKISRWIQSVSESLLAQLPALQEALCAVGYSPEICLAVAEFSTAVHRTSAKYQDLLELRARHEQARGADR